MFVGQNRSQQKEIMNDLMKMHMFSTSKNMSKLQIALNKAGGAKKARKLQWSRPLSLKASEGQIVLIESFLDVMLKAPGSQAPHQSLQLPAAQGRREARAAEPKYLGAQLSPGPQGGAERLEWKASSGVRKGESGAKQQQSKAQREHFQQRQSARKKYVFGYKIEGCRGFYGKSKLIVISPRFIIRNDIASESSLRQQSSCDYIAVAQFETEHVEENIFRIEPGQSEHFYWCDYRKKEHVVMSFYDKSTGNIVGWSKKFRIDKVNDFAVKLKRPKVKVLDQDEYAYQRVSITLQDTVFCVRVLAEDVSNPPYCIENLTRYEIYYRQSIQARRAYCACLRARPRYSQWQMSMLQPAEKRRFTWDELVTEGDHILEV